MRILHTADWHIGKRLHKHYLYQDFDLFIGWLCDLVHQEQIDAILVSGDVFDLANPSAEARKQYFQALIALKSLHCHLIITGGNHDSPSMLDAPKDLLLALEMNMIGGLPELIKDCIIPLPNKENPEVVIAALPYLRDSDVRLASEGNTYEDRLAAIRKGIQAKFDEAAAYCEKTYPNIPAIAMGHLYAAGVSTSESERDIQIGNQAAFKAEQFNTYFSYIALGHIHQPQRVSAQIPTFYSGSPLMLSFSERQDEKRVLLIDTQNGFEPESIAIPQFRKLLKVSGSLEQLQQKLSILEHEGQLNTLIEVEMLEEQYSSQKLANLDELVSNFDKDHLEIIKYRTQFKEQQKQSSAVFGAEQNLEDLKPKEVFESLLENEPFLPEERQELLHTFDELKEMLTTSD
ncbi:exonuclease SbcCD subunit D C-terminal domain-containing protein [Mesonia ostreae]|uniref:Nuclease SbcCD subunit D n=1 Tax=Mesonia ostreae TaxID=861110 RepID=A0ABU2KKL4_9FLAO|nr:exonuclease SbcCD subunit D C-terminal domain-containing protein [Mesonia ostreae]MDT0295194.1 exonuclease SbcCD subunit D C-terminal domain-containing protein [Mesonia ostreae]